MPCRAMAHLEQVNNPELLNLHARQTHPVFHDENVTRASGWMKALARGLGFFFFFFFY